MACRFPNNLRRLVCFEPSTFYTLLAGQLFLHVYATQVQRAELRTQTGESHFARDNLVTQRATEFIEALRPDLLIGRPLTRWHLCNYVHRRKGPDATLKAVGQLLSSWRESQLPVFANGVAAAAAMVVEDILSEFPLVLFRRNHLIQRGTSG